MHAVSTKNIQSSSMIQEKNPHQQKRSGRKELKFTSNSSNQNKHYRKRMWDDRWHLSNKDKENRTPLQKVHGSSSLSEFKSQSQRRIMSTNTKNVSERSNGILICKYPQRSYETSLKNSAVMLVSRCTSPFEETKVQRAIEEFNLCRKKKEKIEENHIANGEKNVYEGIYKYDISSQLQIKRNFFRKLELQLKKIEDQTKGIITEHFPREINRKFRRDEHDENSHEKLGSLFEVQKLSTPNTAISRSTLTNSCKKSVCSLTTKSTLMQHLPLFCLTCKNVNLSGKKVEHGYRKLDSWQFHRLCIDVNQVFESKLKHHIKEFKKYRKERTKLFLQSGMEQVSLVELISEVVLNNLFRITIYEVDSILMEITDGILQSM